MVCADLEEGKVCSVYQFCGSIEGCPATYNYGSCIFSTQRGLTSWQDMPVGAVQENGWGSGWFVDADVIGIAMQGLSPKQTQICSM